MHLFSDYDAVFCEEETLLHFLHVFKPPCMLAQLHYYLVVVY